MKLKYESICPPPPVTDCLFYHTMYFNGNESISGHWEIPDFNNYIGSVDIKNKSILDIGTATGYIAFNAEKEGAAEIIALDAESSAEFRLVPFQHILPYQDIIAFNESHTKENLIPVKNAWWYCWHKYNSKVKCVYMPHKCLYELDDDIKFDIVIAGAIVEHLSDPVFAIGSWTKVAREKVIIPFTPTIKTDDLLMKPFHDFNYPEKCYAWFILSEGLYKKVFSNLGFDVSFKMSQAIDSNGRIIERPTIIAERK